jgi:lipopolysaccharide transport system permease protein
MTLVRNYDAATARRGILAQLRSLPGYPALVWHHRYMVQNFFRRDLLSRVNGSYLGVGWILLQPVFLFVVYYFVFGVMFADRNATAEDQRSYAIYLFSGVIAWQSLIEATSVSCVLIVDNGNLVKKVAFPSEALFVHVAAVAAITYLVGAAVCFATGWALGVLQPDWLLCAIPLVLAVQFVMTIGIGLFLANVYVFVRDVVQLWRLVSMAWMFVTPVFWQPRLLEKLLEGAGHPELLAWVQNLNPAYPLVMAHRIALGAPQQYLGAFWPQLGVAAIWAAALFVVGYCSFMSRKHKYADLI